MFEEIYPSVRRTIIDASMHFVEEAGEFSEAVMAYQGRHRLEDLEQIRLEAADFVSCAFGVWNSIGADATDALYRIVGERCHVCRAPECICSYDAVMGFSLNDRY
jgi:hypothetical protein